MDLLAKFFGYFLSALLLNIFAATADYVPVYMWGSSNKVVVNIPALDRISEDSFKDLFLERLTKNPYVVIFAERNLSPEDFIQRDRAGKTAYTNLSSLKSTEKVSYWPFVQSPIESVKQLEKEVSELSVTSLSENFNVPASDILIVDLNDVKDDEDRYEMLKRHDSTIMSVYRKLQKTHPDILALYTAHHTSWVTPEEVRSHRLARSLLAESENASSENGPKVFNETHALLYLNSSAFYIHESIKVDLLKYSATTKMDKNDTVHITLNSTPSDPSFLLTITRQSGYWYLKNIVVTEAPGKEYNLTVRDVYAPDKFSYHCTKTVFYGANSMQNLSLPGFQIQPRPDGNYTPFGDAYDCVGFTSAPIWSGIFVSFILVLIMTMGLTMMMDIKTMDRFDDPKGKTITINVSE